MPAISIFIEGSLAATVSCDDYDVVNVQAFGNVHTDEFFILEVFASRMKNVENSVFHMFLNAHELVPGQRVRVEFHESQATNPKGRTISELYPDAGHHQINTDGKSNAELFGQLHDMPRLRDQYTLCLESSSGTRFIGVTQPNIHGVSFSVLWDSWSTACAKVALRSHTIENLETRTSGHCYFEEKMQVGGSVVFEPSG